MDHKKQVCRNFIFAVIISVALCYYFQISTGNIAGIIFLFGLFHIFMHTEFAGDRRTKICSGIGASICSAAVVFGKIGRSRESILDALGRFKEIWVKDINTVQVALGGYFSVSDVTVLIVTLVGIWLLFYYVIMKTLEILGHRNILHQTNSRSVNTRKVFWISFILIMVCWLPYFYINFPGVLTVDSINQIAQAEGVQVYNDAHPVIHTMLLAVFYNLGKNIFHASNAGAAFYVFIQMLILAAIYSKLIVLLWKNGLKKLYTGCMLAYFALLPLHTVYAVTMWKDILFSGFVLWFSMSVYEIYVCGKNDYMVWLQFIVMGSFTALFRHNGIIAVVLCVPVLFILLKDKSMKKIICLILPICIFYIVKGPVYDSFNIQRSDVSIPMTIPVQHIARVVVNCSDKLTPEEREMIEQVASLEDIKQIYNCRFADPISGLIQNNGTDVLINKNKWEYFKLWLILGIKHPIQYILAEIDATVGYWYPDEQYSVIFNGVSPNDFGITSLFDTQGEIIKYTDTWCNLYRYVPILGNLFSIGTVFLFMVLAVIKNIYDKQYSRIAVSIPSFMLWLTIMVSTPLHAEMRYVYYMMLTIPLILFTALLPTAIQNE